MNQWTYNDNIKSLIVLICAWLIENWKIRNDCTIDGLIV